MTPRPIILVLGIAACDAGALPPQAPSPPPPPIANTPPPPPIANTHPHEVIATIHRTVCYGTCPQYTITVYRDGDVEYDGDQYVIVKGKATGHIALAQVDAIDKLFVDAHYLTLLDSYEHM